MTGDFHWTCPFCKTTYCDRSACNCSAWTNTLYGNYGHTHSISMPDNCFKSTCNDNIEHERIIVQNEPQKLTSIMYPDTLVVGLYGGPGCGKSTLAAGIFSDLKFKGINCELVSEYAKNLVWEERNHTFLDQIYMFGKQYHSIFRVLGKVDIIVTDSPILLSIIYDYEKRPTFEKLVVEEHKKMWTYNVFIKRVKKYNPKGRNQTEKESVKLDGIIIDMLDKHNECYEVHEGTQEGKDNIVKKILMFLENKP